MATLKNHEISEGLVHQLREANESLVIASLKAQDLQDQAEASVERQTEFLSMLAHELRNPLAPIAMAAEMLDKFSSVHPQLPKIHQIIARQVGNMKRLLEDLLDASRVVSGKVTLKKSPLLLTDMVQGAVEIVQPLLNQHHQKLEVHLPGQPVVIDGDAMRLAQVFSNLLINASKYSPQSACITLSARPGADGMLAISVKDPGVGIDPEVQPFIFDLFTQAPGTLDRSQGGLGIGLSMVRTLLELHGGRVEAQSEGLGHGSEFIAYLPLMGDLAASQSHPALPEYLARPCRVLIIEDNVDANETLNFCLTFEGHTVASAFDGPAGLAEAKTGRYDLVICDIGLPGMDGYEVLRQIHLLDASPAPFCIAMTGYDNQEYRSHAQEVGFDAYLVKPVSIDTLQEVIAKAFPAKTIT